MNLAVLLDTKFIAQAVDISDRLALPRVGDELILANIRYQVNKLVWEGIWPSEERLVTIYVSYLGPRELPLDTLPPTRFQEVIEGKQPNVIQRKTS